MNEASIKELIAQRNELDAKIREIQSIEKAKAISEVQRIVEEFGLSSADVFGSGQKYKGSGKEPGKSQNPKKVAAKFRDPETGNTWSGRGIAPKWIAGQDREKFRVPEDSEEKKDSESTAE